MFLAFSIRMWIYHQIFTISKRDQRLKCLLIKQTALQDSHKDNSDSSLKAQLKPPHWLSAHVRTHFNSHWLLCQMALNLLEFEFQLKAAPSTATLLSEVVG
jgi:hypothetical protein